MSRFSPSSSDPLDWFEKWYSRKEIEVKALLYEMQQGWNDELGRLAKLAVQERYQDALPTLVDHVLRRSDDMKRLLHKGLLNEAGVVWRRIFGEMVDEVETEELIKQCSGVDEDKTLAANSEFPDFRSYFDQSSRDPYRRRVPYLSPIWSANTVIPLGDKESTYRARCASLKEFHRIAYEADTKVLRQMYEQDNDRKAFETLRAHKQQMEQLMKKYALEMKKQEGSNKPRPRFPEPIALDNRRDGRERFRTRHSRSSSPILDRQRQPSQKNRAGVQSPIVPNSRADIRVVIVDDHHRRNRGLRYKQQEDRSSPYNFESLQRYANDSDSSDVATIKPNYPDRRTTVLRKVRIHDHGRQFRHDVEGDALMESSVSDSQPESDRATASSIVSHRSSTISPDSQSSSTNATFGSSYSEFPSTRLSWGTVDTGSNRIAESELTDHGSSMTDEDGEQEDEGTSAEDQDSISTVEIGYLHPDLRKSWKASMEHSYSTSRPIFEPIRERRGSGNIPRIFTSEPSGWMSWATEAQKHNYRGLNSSASSQNAQN